MDVGRKRLLLIPLFLIVVGVLAYALYYLFFRGPQAEPIGTPTGQVPAGQLPTSGTAGQPSGQEQPTGPGGLPQAGVVPKLEPLPGTPSTPRTTMLRSEVTNAVSVAPSGGVRGYSPLDGHFYQIRDDGTTELLSDEVFFNVDKVDWANRSDKAVLTYPDGSNILYDFTTEQQATLPKHWADFSFAPQDEKIVAKSIGSTAASRYLVVANPDGTDAHAVEELGANQDKVLVNWSPNNQVIAFSMTGEPLGADQQSVLLVGQNQENYKALIVEGRGFIPNWSPTGERLLYSVYSAADGYRPALWVSAASGDDIGAQRRNLQLHTWADKCAWQSDTVLFCAVPAQLGEGAGLQRSLFSTVPDSIYRIDLSSGQASNLGVPSGSPSIKSLMISSDGRSLYFTDQATASVSRFGL